MKLQITRGEPAKHPAKCRNDSQNEFPSILVGLHKGRGSVIIEGLHYGFDLFLEVFNPMEFRRMTVEEIKRSISDKLTSNFGCDISDATEDQLYKAIALTPRRCTT